MVPAQAAFTAALETSCAKAFAGAEPGPREESGSRRPFILEDLRSRVRMRAGRPRSLGSLRARDAPALYRAADALDRSGGARELADSLYADLYGVEQRDGERQSLFRYFHGRSSLATWLRGRSCAASRRSRARRAAY